MPDLLVEFFSEEIPARMQAKAAEDLRKLVTERLVEAGLVYEGAKAFATPRRIAPWVQGVPARQPDAREEKKGPRVGSAPGAIAGFVKSAGLTSIEQARVERDEKRGDFYVAVVERRGRFAIDLLGELLVEVVRGFPWPKSMRWGKQSATPGALTWVRPLHSILATFGPETEEPDIVPLTIDGITAGDETRGHRFLSPTPFKVKRLADYTAKLEAAKVVLDAARRREIILADAKNLAFAQGFELIEDVGLLAEVAGLVEWPVVLMGAFDEAFLSIPAEVIRTTIRNNQKCFVLRDARKNALANKFILVANTEAADGGAKIVAGNERVIRARLSDAKFFYETDLKAPLEARLEKLKQIVFHEKLGTQYLRVERIERLARELAPIADADPDKAARAARLCKADLVTEMVGEFPELQGLIGKYYASAQGEDASVARAIEEHYKPLGPSDRVPTDAVSVAVALADKIDTLVGFWAIDERPTGSKDPFALRRAALGLIRLILENQLRIGIQGHVFGAFGALVDQLRMREFEESADQLNLVENKLQIQIASGRSDEVADQIDDRASKFRRKAHRVSTDLRDFLIDRLQVQLRDQGARHDLVKAVVSRPEMPEERFQAIDASLAQKLAYDDILLIVRRVEALAKFLDTDDGKNLLAGYKRATNIIRIEEKKDGRTYHGKPDPHLYLQKEERELAVSIAAAKHEAEAAVAREDFAHAMHAIATLRSFVDAFFDKVTVNVDMADRRENRLKLLNEIREATRAVADFSRIEG